MDRRNRQEQTSVYSEQQVRRVLAESGISIESEVDSDFIIFCPYHNNYRTPAGEVSKTYGTFFCFSCQESRSLVDLITHASKMTYFEALRLIDSAKEEGNIADIVNDILDTSDEVPPFDELLIKRLHNNALDSKRALDYYAYRGISMDSIVKYQLGYSPKQDMITMPSHSPDGSVYYGMVARSIEGKEFLNSNGNWRSKTFFNFHRVRSAHTVYLVESTIDAIRLNQVGVPAIASNGAYTSKYQRGLLTKYFGNVIVLLDNDKAGNKMQDKLLSTVGDIITPIGLPSRFHDIGDMTDEDIQKLVQLANNPIYAIN